MRDTLPELPTWADCKYKRDGDKPLTALEAFIFENDDADPAASDEFFAMLAKVVAEARAAGIEAGRAQAAELRRAVQYITGMLNDKEWAEHISRDPDASALESAITELHNEITTAHPPERAEPPCVNCSDHQQCAAWDKGFQSAAKKYAPERAEPIAPLMFTYADGSKVPIDAAPVESAKLTDELIRELALSHCSRFRHSADAHDEYTFDDAGNSGHTIYDLARAIAQHLKT